jgi:hypothetical protein
MFLVPLAPQRFRQIADKLRELPQKVLGLLTLIHSKYEQTLVLLSVRV